MPVAKSYYNPVYRIKTLRKLYKELKRRRYKKLQKKTWQDIVNRLLEMKRKHRGNEMINFIDTIKYANGLKINPRKAISIYDQIKKEGKIILKKEGSDKPEKYSYSIKFDDDDNDDDNKPGKAYVLSEKDRNIRSVKRKKINEGYMPIPDYNFEPNNRYYKKKKGYNINNDNKNNIPIFRTPDRDNYPRGTPYLSSHNTQSFYTPFEPEYNKNPLLSNTATKNISRSFTDSPIPYYNDDNDDDDNNYKHAVPINLIKTDEDVRNEMIARENIIKQLEAQLANKNKQKIDEADANDINQSFNNEPILIMEEKNNEYIKPEAVPEEIFNETIQDNSFRIPEENVVLVNKIDPIKDVENEILNPKVDVMDLPNDELNNTHESIPYVKDNPYINTDVNYLIEKPYPPGILKERDDRATYDSDNIAFDDLYDEEYVSKLSKNHMKELHIKAFEYFNNLVKRYADFDMSDEQSKVHVLYPLFTYYLKLLHDFIDKYIQPVADDSYDVAHSRIKDVARHYYKMADGVYRNNMAKYPIKIQPADVSDEILEYLDDSNDSRLYMKGDDAKNGEILSPKKWKAVKSDNRLFENKRAFQNHIAYLKNKEIEKIKNLTSKQIRIDSQGQKLKLITVTNAYYNKIQLPDILNDETIEEEEDISEEVKDRYVRNFLRKYNDILKQNGINREAYQFKRLEEIISNNEEIGIDLVEKYARKVSDNNAIISGKGETDILRIAKYCYNKAFEELIPYDKNIFGRLNDTYGLYVYKDRIKYYIKDFTMKQLKKIGVAITRKDNQQRILDLIKSITKEILGNLSKMLTYITKNGWYYFKKDILYPLIINKIKRWAKVKYFGDIVIDNADEFVSATPVKPHPPEYSPSKRRTPIVQHYVNRMKDIGRLINPGGGPTRRLSNEREREEALRVALTDVDINLLAKTRFNNFGKKFKGAWRKDAVDVHYDNEDFPGLKKPKIPLWGIIINNMSDEQLDNGGIGHWVACVVDNSKKEILYYDPLGHEPYPEFEERIKPYKKEGLDADKYQLKINRVPHQGRDQLCGWYCLNFLDAVLNRRDNFMDASGFTIANVRKQVELFSKQFTMI